MKKHLTHSFCTLWREHVSAEKSYLLRTGLQGQRKSNLRTCGSISRCSADLRPCVCGKKRETTSSLSNQTSWDFFNADRDLHYSVCAWKSGNTQKKRNVWHHFRGIPDPPVGSAEREWNRCISIKSESQRWPFTQTEKGIACLSHSSHVPLMMTDTSKGKGSLLREIFKR